MINIYGQNSAISNVGLIYNWNTITKWDKNNEALIYFENPYSVQCSIDIEPQSDCIIFDLNPKSFRVKRKNKRVKEVKWFAIGY